MSCVVCKCPERGMRCFRVLYHSQTHNGEKGQSRCHFASYLAYSASMDQLAGLTEEARKLALDRFHLVQTHLEDDRRVEGGRVGALSRPAVQSGRGLPCTRATRSESLARRHGANTLLNFSLAVFRPPLKAAFELFPFQDTRRE
jgi:hypothetical protein